MDFKELVELVLSGKGKYPPSKIFYELSLLMFFVGMYDTVLEWNEKDFPNREVDFEIRGIKYFVYYKD